MKPVQSEQDRCLQDLFVFREFSPEDLDQVIAIEGICFPPNEACTPDMMRKRMAAAPELCLIAQELKTGRAAGFLNGIATDEAHFQDAFFTDPALHQADGAHVMICGLDVLPEYRGIGLARELVRLYSERERLRGRKSLVLTCLPKLVEMYRKFGFYDLGKADSTWGGEIWHEMDLPLKVTTLCYIEQNGRWLMMYRNKKENDYNQGKWIGIGGKTEAGETPEECLQREVREETGLVLKSYRYLGDIVFRSDVWDDEVMKLYLGMETEGDFCEDSREGTLKWIPKDEVLRLPLWEGDRYFLERMLQGDTKINLELRYKGDALVSARKMD